MIKKLKVMTIVGTRPELIKMSRVINIFDQNTTHVIVHTGQNYDYELNQIFFDDLNIRKPDYFLNINTKSPAQAIGKIISESDKIMDKEKPDAVLLYGDTNSCLSVISAKRRKIPIFHMEAGNRCFDQRVPEEINRKIVDHTSDINLVLTEHARRYLIKEGIREDTIFKTGSHMKEVLDFYMPKIKKSKILKNLKLKKNKYFLLSVHREENVDDTANMRNLIETLKAIVSKYQLQVIVSTHPRTKNKIEEKKIKQLSSKIKFLKPFGFCDYINLQQNALCVISDSGTITEETSILNLKSINIRNAHERPEGMDVGSLIMSGVKKDDVLMAIDKTLNQHKKTNYKNTIVEDYNVENVSRKILFIVLSYVNYVNSFIWKKNS